MTIYDVAQAAGVGVGTVSRLINHESSLRPETAAKVRRAMKELGYSPPPLDKRRGPTPGTPRRPRNDQDNVLLLLSGGSNLKWMLDGAPIYAYVIHGIEAELPAQHRNLIIRQAPTWADFERAISLNRANGIIVLGLEPKGDPPEQLSKTPAVWVMGNPRHSIGDHVFPDHVAVGKLAAKHLLELGHKNCAYLGLPEKLSPAEQEARGASFRQAIETAGGHVQMLTDPDLVVTTENRNDVNEARLGRLLDQMLASEPRPSALMLQVDLFTSAAYHQLRERGIEPQRDIAIVTCNNEQPYLIGLTPQPSIIDLRAETIGQTAVRQLLWRRKNFNAPHLRIMVEPTLIPSQDR